MSGFENTKIQTLEAIRDNLLRGLETVAESIDKGTFHKVGPKGSASPSESGQLTLALLNGIEAELEKRST